jgi:hypothetical protein
MAQPPLAVGRVLIPVTYLASAAVHTAQSVAHFYMVSENESRIPKGKKPQRRVAIIADRATFQADLDAAMNRCVMFSQITELSLLEEHLAPLTGPFTELDFVLQQSPSQDFIRLVAAVFKPMQSVSTVPTFTLEAGNAVNNRAHCRLAMNALQDVVGTAAQEASVRSLRATKDRELQALQEALQKQKDESLLEMVDLHTQKESLKHALAQAEQVLASTRRAAKEERDLMLAKIKQLEAERDVKLGKQPGWSPSSFDIGSLAVPPPGSGLSNSRGGASPLERTLAQEVPYRPDGLGSPGQAPISTYNTGANTGLSFSTNAPGNRPLGREQLSSATYAAMGVTSPGQRSAIQPGSPYTPMHAAQSSSPWAQHSLAAAQPSPYSSHGGNMSGIGSTSSAALDQLQNQLTEGERFLLSLQQKKAAAGRY